MITSMGKFFAIPIFGRPVFLGLSKNWLFSGRIYRHVQQRKCSNWHRIRNRVYFAELGPG